MSRTTDPAALSPDERRRRINGYLVERLREDPAERQHMLDEAVLLRIAGGTYTTAAAVHRELAEQYGGDDFREWPDEAQQKLLRAHLTAYMAKLPPEELSAIQAASEGGE